MTKTVHTPDALALAGQNDAGPRGPLGDLHGLLQKQAACLEALAKVSNDQAAQVEQGGDATDIDRALALRQRLLDQLIETQAKWDTAQLDGAVGSVGAERRKDLADAVEAVAALHDAALQADRRLSAAVESAAGRVNQELRQTFTGGKAIGAYRAPAAQGTPRFTDQTG